MKNAASVHKYYKILTGLFEKYISKTEFTPEKRDELLRNSQLMSIMDLSPGIIWIADLKAQGYIFVSDNIKYILGYHPEEFYQHGLKKTVTIFPGIHNEIILQKIFPIMFDYFDRHCIKGDIKDLRVSYNSLMVGADGEARWYLHQATVIQKDEEQKARLMLKLITDIHDIKQDDSITLTISLKDKRGIYSPVFTKRFYPNGEDRILSDREIEILNLLGEGRTSKQIASTLNLSEHTVKTHRKNMHKKLNVKNTTELLNKSIANSLF
jgi:DNA-binding CsgD family transcriptional regulator